MSRHRTTRTVMRRGGGPLGFLASALAGGTAIAGHTLIGPQGVHPEDLALAAVLTSTDTQRLPPAQSVRPTPDSLDAATARELPATGAANALALAYTADVDITAIVEAATTAARKTEDIRRETTRKQAPNPPGDTGGTEDSANRSGPTGCDGGREGFGAVASKVAVAGEELRCKFAVDTVFGIAGRSGASDHPNGKALDFMVERAAGDQLAGFATENLQRLGIKYLIYRQRINFGQGWEPMEDRGGATANHMDHVHISFD